MINVFKKNILSIITALVILYLSLASSDTFNKVNEFKIPNLDKVVHICMYFGLMLVLLYENRLKFKHSRGIFLLSIVSLLYGILMEILQSWLTSTRKGDVIDALFDLAGIVLAILVWILFHNLRRKSV